MKLHDSLGPNPRLVRMFAAEKGIELERVSVDLPGGENRRAPYTDKNPYGQLPTLELDDGTWIGETVAICEYLEELQPEPVLIGSTPKERAETRMWTRRIEHSITAPMADGFRFAEGLALFKDRMHTIPHAADDLKALGREGLEKLDGLIAGRDFIAGDRLTLADLVAYALVDFFGSVGQPLDPKLKNVASWKERMDARPTATASLHEAAAGMGMRG